MGSYYEQLNQNSRGNLQQIVLQTQINSKQVLAGAANVAIAIFHKPKYVSDLPQHGLLSRNNPLFVAQGIFY